MISLYLDWSQPFPCSLYYHVPNCAYALSLTRCQYKVSNTGITCHLTTLCCKVSTAQGSQYDDPCWLTLTLSAEWHPNPWCLVSSAVLQLLPNVQGRCPDSMGYNTIQHNIIPHSLLCQASHHSVAGSYLHYLSLCIGDKNLLTKLHTFSRLHMVIQRTLYADTGSPK